MPTIFAKPSRDFPPWVADSQATSPMIAIGEVATIQFVSLNIAPSTASSTPITGLPTSPSLARLSPNSTANTSVGSTFCAAMTATTLEGIRSRRNLTQSTEMGEVGRDAA